MDEKNKVAKAVTEQQIRANIPPVIRLEHVSKRFDFTEERSESVLESLISRLSPRRWGRTASKDLWAVNDVTFDVAPGQCLGIIGRNGSGKSTLMKLIARILRPNDGRIMVRGRVSALLELGAGFHTDLSGRENIYLNASVLGLSKQEIERHFDAVVAFSELEEFIDMPVKHYSSGMYMRLGISVAIHVQPDILIVDEILAVGDQAFQEKCIERIYDLKHQGVTIVLVSHSLDMVRKLCTHLVWVENGQLRAQGPTEELIQQYLSYLYDREPRQARLQTSDFERWGTGDIEITAVRFCDDGAQEKQAFKTGEPMTIEMAYTAHRPINEPEFGLAIHRRDGLHVNGPNNQIAGLKTGIVSGSGVLRYRIEQLPLLPAEYRVTVAIHDSRRSLAYDYHKQAYPFRIISGGTRETQGLLALPASWEMIPAAATTSLPDPGLMPLATPGKSTPAGDE